MILSHLIRKVNNVVVVVVLGKDNEKTTHAHASNALQKQTLFLAAAFCIINVVFTVEFPMKLSKVFENGFTFAFQDVWRTN